MQTCIQLMYTRIFHCTNESNIYREANEYVCNIMTLNATLRWTTTEHEKTHPVQCIWKYLYFHWILDIYIYTFGVGKINCFLSNALYGLTVLNYPMMSFLLAEWVAFSSHVICAIYIRSTDEHIEMNDKWFTWLQILFGSTVIRTSVWYWNYISDYSANENIDIMNELQIYSERK